MKTKVLVLLTILVLLVVAGGVSAQEPVGQAAPGNEITRILPGQGALPAAPEHACPFGTACNVAGYAYIVRNVNAGGTGILGWHHNVAGVAPGVYGYTSSAAAQARGVLGVVGPAAAGVSSAGVRGINNGAGAGRIGVWGSAAGVGWGVYGSTPGGLGVYGASNTGWGVYGFHANAAGTAAGVYGRTNSAAVGAPGVLGIVGPVASGAWSAGVRGINNGAGAARIGVLGSAAGNGWGVYGSAAGNGLGVYGYSPGGRGVYGASTAAVGIYGWTGAANNNWAGFFDGNVHVVNRLTAGVKGFRIDHPLDPADKYLNHSNVESPDMLNMYNGNIVLDKNGEAWVELPEWFGAVNGDYRYQLTALDAPGPNLYIAERIQDNRFKIAGGVEGMAVSWLVTGIRQDPYAKANRIAVEEDKPLGERGLYLHPELYGQPEEKGLARLHAHELPEGASALEMTLPEPLLDEPVLGSELDGPGFEDLSRAPLLDEPLPGLE